MLHPRETNCCNCLFTSLTSDKMLLICCWHLFVLQDKSGSHKDIYPYLIQELMPTLSELGISTPEELGIDKL